MHSIPGCRLNEVKQRKRRAFLIARSSVTLDGCEQLLIHLDAAEVLFRMNAIRRSHQRPRRQLERLRKDLRILRGHIPYKRIALAGEAFQHTERVAVKAPVSIEPCAVIEVDGLHHKRVPLPPAERVAIRHRDHGRIMARLIVSPASCMTNGSILPQ